MTPAERAAVLRRASAKAAAGDWWTDHEQLAELWRWLEDRGQEPDDVGHFLEKPWHWTPEYDEMVAERTAPL